ncbi:MAG: PP2C family protein-serine/threonine phosphatase [Leptospiraceae bacterium]|nr:PP2C family protein-serine/threonine phosphatase [Leptospiraceae bacterium]
MKTNVEKSYFQNRFFKINSFVFVGSLICFIILLFANVLDNKSFVLVTIVLFGYYILIHIVNITLFIKMEKYQKIADYLDITDTISFEIKNRYANKLIYPSNIKDDNFEVVTISKAMTYLGGDIHFQMKDEKGDYWFAIGDATGHDINSHLFSIMILSQLSSLIHRELNPKVINTKINEHVEKSLEGENRSIPFYASMVLLKSSPNGNFQHYGQHPNMILFRNRSGETEIIETSGKFIGIDSGNMAQVEDELREFKLEKNDILFVFTDGVFEQKNKEGRYFGFRLYQFIQKESKVDLEIFSQKLLDEIQEFGEGEIDDDLTFMAIRKK